MEFFGVLPLDMARNLPFNLVPPPLKPASTKARRGLLVQGIYEPPQCKSLRRPCLPRLSYKHCWQHPLASRISDRPEPTFTFYPHTFSIGSSPAGKAGSIFFEGFKGRADDRKSKFELNGELEVGSFRCYGCVSSLKFLQKIFITVYPEDWFLPPIRYQFHLGDICSVHVFQERLHRAGGPLSSKDYELTLTLIARRPARISIKENNEDDRFRRATDMDFNLLGKETHEGVISPIPEGKRAATFIHVSVCQKASRGRSDTWTSMAFGGVTDSRPESTIVSSTKSRRAYGLFGP